jgi:vacuolar protein sorting-associated protein 13A/C
LLKGATGLGRGIVSGVAGLFRKPIEGARESGAGGMIKGIGEGVVGLALKPLTGVVDLV